MKDRLLGLTGVEIREKISNSQIDGQKVYFYFKEKAERIDSALNSFVEVYPFSEEILPSSEDKNGGWWKGVPIGVKDNICIKGKKITCCSKILEGHIASYDATVIKRLKKAGLRIMGVTNMDEFAFGSSTENSCYYPTKNPWDLTRVPGGSSGGSAAAVAARLVPFALGSDTGGSIRQPSCFCGVVGFKPTYGRVSRFGLVAFGSSLDQIGPITTNFVDCAYLLNILCGFDSKDSTTSKKEVPDFTNSLVDDVKGLKIGLPKEYFGEGLEPIIKEKIEEVKALLLRKKAKFLEISLPHTEYAIATYYIIAPCEASSNLQRFDGIKYGLRVEGNNLMDLYKKTRGEGFGPEVKRRIFLGTYSLSRGYYDAYYLKALKVRTLIAQDFHQAFKEVDVILTPTSPTLPFKIGEKIEDPLSMYLSDIYTISANLSGLPAVSFPCGFSKEGLPIGAQLIGKPFDEETLVRVGFTYQSHTEYHKIIPKIAQDEE